jgi:hypothetical protein
VDKERPTFLDAYNEGMKNVLGDRFEPYGVSARAEKNSDAKSTKAA